MTDINRIPVPETLPAGVAVVGNLATFIIPNPSNPDKPRVTTCKVENGAFVLIPAKSFLHKLAADLLE